MALIINIGDFEEGKEIPKKFTCDGTDYSPSISWENVPKGTQSLALVVDDPDAPVGNFVHWVIYNIKPEKNGLPENFPKSERTSEGITQGRNDFGKIGYNGPCPPRGHGYHRYYFTLYALSTPEIAKAGVTKEGLMDLTRGKIIEKGSKMGIYKRN